MTSTHTVPPADPGAAPAPPEEAVAPLMRGIAVLRGLTDAGGAAALSDVGRATGLARSTIDRVTGTLARMGYVRLQGNNVALAPRLMELGNSYLAALRLPGLLGAHADALADELDESVSSPWRTATASASSTRPSADAPCRSASASATCCPLNAPPPGCCWPPNGVRTTGLDGENGGSPTPRDSASPPSLRARTAPRLKTSNGEWKRCAWTVGQWTIS